MQALLIVVLAISACQVETQSSKDKSLLKAGGKTMKELSEALSPKIKLLVKHGASKGDYDELAGLLKAGKTEGKAAARAFRRLVKEPLVEVDELIERLKLSSKPNPLKSESYNIVRKNLHNKLDELSKTIEEHNQALTALKKQGVDTRDLRVKVEVQQARRWKGVLKKDYPNLFDKMSSLEIPINRTTDMLAGASAVMLPLSLKEFMTKEE